MVYVLVPFQMSYDLIKDFNEQSEDLTNIKFYPNWPFKLLKIYLASCFGRLCVWLPHALCSLLKFAWLKGIIQCRAQLQTCSDNQEGVSEVLSRTPAEAIKKSHGLEYKFIHPQIVAVPLLSLNLQKRQNFRKLLLQKSNNISMTSLLIKTSRLKKNTLKYMWAIILCSHHREIECKNSKVMTPTRIFMFVKNTSIQHPKV